jgi:hypothetical protein
MKLAWTSSFSRRRSRSGATAPAGFRDRSRPRGLVFDRVPDLLLDEVQQVGDEVCEFGTSDGWHGKAPLVSIRSRV